MGLTIISRYYTLFILPAILAKPQGTIQEINSFSNLKSEGYDEKLSEFLREILENFRDQMPDGIPDIGVPPIDPLTLPNINEDINDEIAKMALRMHDLNITGISRFEIETLKADLQQSFANFSLKLPELTAEGRCYMDGKILGIFPMKSDGPFYIHVEDVKIVGRGELNLTTGGDVRMSMNDLTLNLTFGPLQIQFDSLLGGGRWTKMLLKLLTGLGPKLFLHFHEPAMAELNKALLKLINKELEKGTLKEILDKIDIPMAPKNDAKY